MSLFRKFTVIILTVWTLIACESPLQSGLGDKVDITAPKISLEEPAAGQFIKDKIQFVVNATDDIAVQTVLIAWGTEEDWGRPAEMRWVPAVFDEESQRWVYTLNTLEEFKEDGDIKVKIRALDRSGKETLTEELVYTVKNHPPQIELAIPAWKFESGKAQTDKDVPELVAGGVMIGYASDLQGVKPGYPKIKLWVDGETPPDTWADMDVPDPNPENGWNEANPEAGGKRSLEFRYKALDRGTGNPLDPNKRYRVKFWVMDISGGEAFFPETPTDPNQKDGLLLKIITADELPLITFRKLDNTYQNKEFQIEANIYHSLGTIKSSDPVSPALTVTKEGEQGEIFLDWEMVGEEERVPKGDGKTTLQRTVKSGKITSGETYPNTNGTPCVFTNGTYTFSIEAISSQGSVSPPSTYTIYIDTTAPATEITRVDPVATTETLSWGGVSATRYTVNGRIALDISTFDLNGLGVISEGDDAGKRELKYLVLDAPAPDGQSAEKLYQ
ncbi:MAG: hypothetical protein LBP93_07785, partial [Treponema sp.]|nr:hypothetical protein [Treponema sp.]